MKMFLLFFLVVFNQSIFASGMLSCSANGTFVYHIPGAFTSQNDQSKAEFGINDILTTNKNYFDLKSQDAKTIKIFSQGLLQDKLNYIFNSFGTEGEAAWIAMGGLEYGYRLSTNIQTISNGGAVINKFVSSGARGVVGNIKTANESGLLGLFRAQANLSGQGVKTVNSLNSDRSLMETLAMGSTGTGFANKLLSLTGLGSMSNPVGWGLTAKNVLNMASIYALEGDFTKAINQDQDTALAAYYTTQNNVNNIATQIKTKLDQNQKVILSAHGEGNQLAARAVAQIQTSGTIDQQNKLSKFVSVLATSPTTSVYTNKYFDMRNDLDNRLNGSYAYTTYHLQGVYEVPTNASDFFTSILDSVTLHTRGSDFLKYYISEVQLAQKNSIGDYLPMRTHYINQLRASAETLQDNCSTPDIDITVAGAVKNSVDPTIFDYQGFTNYNNQTSITARDNNDTDTDTDQATKFSFDYYVFNFDHFQLTTGGSYNYNFNVDDSLLINPTLRYWFTPKTQSGINTISDFSIPFSVRTYSLKVTAVNKYGKMAEKYFKLSVPQDQTPTVSIVNRFCQITWSSGAYAGRNYQHLYALRLLVSDPDSPAVTCVDNNGRRGDALLPSNSLLNLYGWNGGYTYFESTLYQELDSVLTCRTSNQGAVLLPLPGIPLSSCSYTGGY